MKITTLFGAADRPRGGTDGAALHVVPALGALGPEMAFVAPVTGPVWRLILPAPPDVRLDDGAGTWCPLCDGLLAVGTTGWACLAGSCMASWDFHGRRGRWEGQR